MAYISCKFHFFLCFGRLLPNGGKSRSCHPFFHCVSLPFSCSYSALGRSIWDNCWKRCNFHAFPTAGRPQFYDFSALRGPNRVSFVHCQGFLRNLSMTLHTNRWHMAYFLCNFQGFPLLWAASAKMLKSCNFHAFPTAAKHHFYDFIAPRPNFIRPLPRFPAEFEHGTTYKQMAHGLLSLQFSRFSFALGRFF